MLKRLQNNLLYKIIAFVIALLFWLVVYNADNPLVTVRLTVPITITNQNAPQLNNFRILNDYDESVIVEVRGRQSEIEQVNISDFSILYDFSEITSSAVSALNYIGFDYIGDRAIDYIVINNGKIALEVENLSIAERKIEVELSGEPAYGYSIVNVVYSPENFTIKDVQSLVTKIAKAIVPVDVSGIKGNSSIRKYCEFYDSNGDRINELNDYQYIDVEIEVAKEFPVEAAKTGIPNAEYQVKQFEAQPSTIKITGSEESLLSIESIKLESISVSGEDREYFTKKAAIINLPAGCKVVGGLNEMDVAVVMEQLIEKTFTFNKDEIEFKYKNNYDQYSYFLLDNNVSITLKGLEEELNDISNELLQPFIDVNLLTDTIIALPVVIIVPANVKQVSFPTTEVKILKNNTLQINTDDIYITNARYELYDYSFTFEKTQVVLSGFTEYLNEVSLNGLNPEIDVKDLKIGAHEIILNIELPENVEMFNSVYIDIVIKAK